MLYTASMLKQKLNVPDEIFMGHKEYSWRMDWRVNGWLFLATIVSSASDIMFPHVVQQWPVAGRAALVLVQFLAIALWVRNLVRWIRGMDELHRRITVSAALFAVSATFFFIMLWHRLDDAGLFQAMFKRGDWDIATVCHGFLLLTLFYFGGYRIFNRRYQ